MLLFSLIQIMLFIAFLPFILAWKAIKWFAWAVLIILRICLI